MSIELTEVASCGINRATSQDSEYDDALEVPDSLEITINENGETIQICKEETERGCNKGMHLYNSITDLFPLVSIFVCLALTLFSLLHNFLNYILTYSQLSSLYIY